MDFHEIVSPSRPVVISVAVTPSAHEVAPRGAATSLHPLHGSALPLTLFLSHAAASPPAHSLPSISCPLPGNEPPGKVKCPWRRTRRRRVVKVAGKQLFRVGGRGS